MIQWPSIREGRSGLLPRQHFMSNKAIIWDYDGTLVDTRVKNFEVTKRLMHRLLGARSGEFPALRRLDQYVQATRTAENWRALYRNEFGMTEGEIDEAGRLWTEFQLTDDGESTLFEGIEEVIPALSVYAQLIFSQNSRSNILRDLKKKGLLQHFVDVVGYEEVASARQKPAPDGLLACLSKIEPLPRELVFFIGDHETDTLCGHNTNVVLAGRNSDARIINIAALYGSENGATSRWNIQPDHMVNHPRAIVEYIQTY